MSNYRPVRVHPGNDGLEYSGIFLGFGIDWDSPQGVDGVVHFTRAIVQNTSGYVEMVRLGEIQFLD